MNIRSAIINESNDDWFIKIIAENKLIELDKKKKKTN